MARSRGTQTRSQKSTAEAKLIEMLERELAESRKQNAKLLRLVEMVMEERFYRPTVTGGVRENVQSSGLPLESLNDVAVFDSEVDAAQMHHELRDIEEEHRNWRKERDMEDADASVASVS